MYNTMYPGGTHRYNMHPFNNNKKDSLSPWIFSGRTGKSSPQWYHNKFPDRRPQFNFMGTDNPYFGPYGRFVMKSTRNSIKSGVIQPLRWRKGIQSRSINSPIGLESKSISSLSSNQAMKGNESNSQSISGLSADPIQYVTQSVQYSPPNQGEVSKYNPFMIDQSTQTAVTSIKHNSPKMKRLKAAVRSTRSGEKKWKFKQKQRLKSKDKTRRSPLDHLHFHRNHRPAIDDYSQYSDERRVEDDSSTNSSNHTDDSNDSNSENIERDSYSDSEHGSLNSGESVLDWSSDGESVESSTSADVLMRERFNVLTKFQNYLLGPRGAATSNSRNHGITEKRMQDTFLKLSRGATTISRKRFMSGIRKLGMEHDIGEMRKRFKAMDDSDTGSVDYAAFRQCILGPRKAKLLTMTRLKKTFDAFDSDRAGYLDLKEFTKACEALKFGTGETLKKYFIEVIEDGSGLMDFHQFVEALTGSEVDVSRDYRTS